ncbi:MAG: glycosyltransferase family 87 protein [Xanthobacteraceae bacterium]
MGQAGEILRSGAWLTRERIRLIAAAILIASVAGFLYLVVTVHGLVDQQGRPLGTDFSDVYAAGTYVLEGDPEAPFDPPRQHAREQQIFGEATPFYGWHYPPFFLFAAAALALMPYGIALGIWQAVTLGLYLLTIRAIVRSPSQDNGALGMRADWLLLALAFPAVLINIGHGQNGFLTATLVGAALMQLNRRPLLAGILFGLLAYKPQFGLLIPVVLAASGRWRSFAAAAGTVVLLALVTTFAFGPHVWRAFLDSTRFTRIVALEQGDTGWYKIQSSFAWARMWGASVTVAYALQAALVVALGAALIWLWRSGAPYPLKAAALCLAAILATPYTLDYDMMVLAPAIAFVAVDGFARGFGPWEKTALAALWLVPLAARSVAHVTLIPLGVPIMLAIFILLLRRSTIRLAFPMASPGAFILK